MFLPLSIWREAPSPGPLTSWPPGAVSEEWVRCSWFALDRRGYLQAWVEETDVDGFNLAYAVAHETFEDIVGYLVPELQKRGVYRTAYSPGTLREKLFAKGPLLLADHPAAQYRDIEAFKRRTAATSCLSQSLPEEPD